MVSSGKGDVGVSKLTGEVFDIMEKMPTVVEKLTGINIQKVGLLIAYIKVKAAHPQMSQNISRQSSFEKKMF
jgi:hypothetical protein